MQTNKASNTNPKTTITIPTRDIPIDLRSLIFSHKLITDEKFEKIGHGPFGSFVKDTIVWNINQVIKDEADFHIGGRHAKKKFHHRF